MTMQIRHASDFFYESELKVAQALQAALPSESIVIMNYFIPHRERGPQETDIVCISPLGIFVIEVKYWLYDLHFRGDEFDRLLNGHYVEQRNHTLKPRTKTFQRAKGLAELLHVWRKPDEDNVIHLDIPNQRLLSVIPIVIIARNDVELTGDVTDENLVRVTSLNEGIELIRNGSVRYSDSSYTHGSRQVPKLTAIEITKIANAIFDPSKNQPASEGRLLEGYYKIISRINHGHDIDEEEFWGITTNERQPRRVRLRRQLLPLYRSISERDEQRKNALRLYDVLSELQVNRMIEIPLVERPVYDAEEDNCVWIPYEGVQGEYIDESDKLKSRDYRERRTKVLEALANVADTLSDCHKKGIIHRALTARCLLIRNGDRRPFRPTILHFDLARLEDTSWTVWAKVAATNPLRQRYIAPEVLKQDAQLDGRADQYSLGVVLCKLLIGEPICSADDIKTRFRANSIPEKICQLALKMTSEDQADRYDNMIEVASALRSSIES